ncbi:MAG: hypothetical protein LR015_00805 [Verrucomicrobia bacterium]|nr:hypothetical protein [Verrucomicrobiota bacterium]
MRGPIVDVINHGSAEIWGGSMNVTHDTLDINPADTIMLRSVDGNISANFIEHAQLSGGASGWGRHQYVAVESRNGEQRSLLNSDPSITHNTSAPPQFGAVITLFTGFFEQNNPDNQAPVLTSLRANVDATGLNYRFTASGFDPDQFPAGHTRLHWRAVSGPGIVRTANHVGEEVDFTFDVGGDYAIELTATDGALQTSYIFPVRVQPRNYQRTLQRDDVYRYVDNAPQNGVPNLFHPALLQLGDDATNAHSHLRFELDLRSLSGSASRIDSATLQLRVDALNGLSSFTVGYADAQSLGVFASADFSIPRIITGSVSLQGVQVGDWITIDIADAVHFGLENGHDYVSLWLQSDFSNDNTAQFVRFYSTVAQAVTDRPVFSVQLDKPSIVDSAAPVGQGWRFHAVLGHLFPFEDWIFSAHLGWIYTTETIDDSSGFFAYVVDRGWIYSSDRFYPWIFDFDASEWSWLPELGLIP